MNWEGMHWRREHECVRVAGVMLVFLGGYAISGAGVLLNLFLLSPFLFLTFSYGYSSVSNSLPPDRPIFLIPSLDHLHPKVRYLNSKAHAILFSHLILH